MPPRYNPGCDSCQHRRAVARRQARQAAQQRDRDAAVLEFVLFMTAMVAIAGGLLWLLATCPYL